jgi:hypothetical protein
MEGESIRWGKHNTGGLKGPFLLEKLKINLKGEGNDGEKLQ